MVGVPKTIDNDIAVTDVTFGFDTAVGVATEALDRLKTTASPPAGADRGGHRPPHGWIALHSGMAAGAHAISVVPERPFDIEELAARVGERFEAGKRFAIVVAAEGAKPRPGTMEFDEGGKDVSGHERFARVARQLSLELEERLGKEARPVILGHVQRGGTPTASTACSPRGSAGARWRPRIAATSGR